MDLNRINTKNKKRKHAEKRYSYIGIINSQIWKNTIIKRNGK